MGCSKTALRGKFIAVPSFLKKQEKRQIDNLTLHLKQLDREEQKTTKLVKGTTELLGKPYIKFKRLQN